MTHGSFTAGCKEGSQKTEEQEEVILAREQQEAELKDRVAGPIAGLKRPGNSFFRRDAVKPARAQDQPFPKKLFDHPGSCTGNVAVSSSSPLVTAPFSQPI